jgi:hypothetical protein
MVNRGASERKNILAYDPEILAWRAGACAGICQHHKEIVALNSDKLLLAA